MARSDRLKTLSEAVASTFEAAGFSPAELLQGPITLTDLTWQAPPLKTEATLARLPFTSYVDYPLPVDSAKMYEYYKLGIFVLGSGPEEIADEQGYRGLSKFIFRCKHGERKLALPLFAGFPVGDHVTGVHFAMDMAHLFWTSSEAVEEFVDDANNYCVKTKWGYVGVKDGYVADGREQWDVNCSGLVQGMLEQPRGVYSTTCHYDLIARLRSVLHLNPDRFSEFEGTDYGLQALRIVTEGLPQTDLIRSIEGMSKAGFKRRAKIAAYQQTLEIMASWELTDRAKISMLQEILIPQYMTLETFCRKIVDLRKVLPAVLSTAVERKIKSTLEFELSKVQYADKALSK